LENLTLDLFDVLEEGLAEGGGGNERLPFIKFPEGNTHITVMAVAKARWTHYIPESKLTINCPGKATCPVCAIISAAKKNDQDCDYKSTQKFGMIVYNHGTKTIEVLDQKVTFIKGLKGMLDELKDDGEEFNPTKFVTRIRRDGLGFSDTKYGFKVAPKANQEDVPQAAYDKIKSIVIEDVFLALEPDNIKKLISGMTLKEIFNPDTGSDEVVVNFDK